MSLGSIFSAIGHFFLHLIDDAISWAKQSGLTDELVQDALVLVQQAQTQFVDNAQKQAFVSSALQAKGVPAAIANLAVELAVQLFDKEAAALAAKAASSTPPPAASA